MAGSSARTVDRAPTGSALAARLLASLHGAAARLLRRAPRASLVALDLADSRAWSGRVGRGGATVRCAAGAVWVTREGDPEDRVLEPGQSFRSETPGRIALLALGRARVVVSGDLASRSVRPPPR
jgi:hypothetical protein